MSEEKPDYLPDQVIYFVTPNGTEENSRIRQLYEKGVRNPEKEGEFYQLFTGDIQPPTRGEFPNDAWVRIEEEVKQAEKLATVSYTQAGRLEQFNTNIRDGVVTMSHAIPGGTAVNIISNYDYVVETRSHHSRSVRRDTELKKNRKQGQNYLDLRKKRF